MKLKSLMIKVILLSMITVLVAGIISCGGTEDIAGSRGGYVEVPITPPDTNEDPEPPVELGENNGDGDSVKKWNIWETKGQTFARETYVDIYAPWVEPNWFKLSYEDTNRLDRMWKAMIDRMIRDVKNPRRRLFIHTTSSGDLYFDQDYNIRWTKQRDKVLKKFRGGAISQLKEGYGNKYQASFEYGPIKYSGYYVLAGLYSYNLDYNTVSQWNTDAINCFFGAAASQTSTDSLKVGRIELLMLHPGYPVELASGRFYVVHTRGKGEWPWKAEAYALQVLMPSTFMDDVSIVRGKSPAVYLSSFNVTHQLYHKDLRWSHNKDYSPYNFWYYDESKNW